MSDTFLESRLIGEIFVERGLVQPDQLEQALRIQEERGGALGEILVDEFGVSRVELASVLAEQWADAERTARAENGDAPSAPSQPGQDAADPEPLPSTPRRPIGQIFVERGLATEEQLAAALEQQRETGGRLGEILVEHGVLTRLDLAGALADQWASLQKLRPPEPRPVEPWQQVAPREPAPAAEPATAVGDTLAIASALAELRLRVGEIESAAGNAPWRDELRSATDGVAARISTLEARLERVADGDALASVQSALAELQQALAEPLARLDSLEPRLAETISPHELDERVSASVADVGARLDALAERLTAPEELAALRDALSGLEQRLGELPATADELRHGLGAVEDRLGGLEQRIADDRELLAARPEHGDELRALVERVAEVEAHAARASSAADAAVPESHLTALSRRLDALEAARPTTDDAAAGELAETVGDLRARLDALRADVARGTDVESLRSELATLADRVAAVAAPDTAELERFRARLAELDARVEHLISRDELTALADELRAHLAERAPTGADAAQRELLEGLSARVDALAAEAARGTDVESLRSELATLADRVAAVAAPDTDELERLRAELADLRTLAANAADGGRLAELTARLDSLRTRLDDGPSRDELTALADDQRRQLEDLSTRLEGALGDRAATVDSRLDALEAAAREEPPSGAVDELVARVSALGERVDTLSTDIAPRDELDRLRAELTALAEREAGGDPAAADETRARLDELSRSLGDVQRAVAEARQIASGAAAAKDELRSRVDALASDTAREWDVESLRSQLEALEGVTAGERVTLYARIDRLDAALADAAGRADALEQGRLAELSEAADSLRAQVDALRSGLRDGRASLDARIDELAGAVDGLRTDAADRVGNDELRQVADEVAALATRLGNGATRDELEAVAGELRAQLAALSARAEASAAALDAVRDATETAVRDAAAAFRTTLDAREGTWRADHAALAAELHERLSADEATLESLRESADAALGEAVRALEERIDGRDATQRDERFALSRELHGRIRAGEKSLGELRESLAELHAAVADRDEWRGRVEAGLAHRLDTLAAEVTERGEAIASLREDADARANELTALQGHVAGELDDVRGAVRDGLARVERQLATAADERDAATRAAADELARLDEEVRSLATDTRAGRDELAAQLEQATGSLAWRVEQIERALGEANLTGTSTRLDALEQRMADGSSIVDEHVRVTERALRKGLAALGARISEAEGAYRESGDALRRSIERLGSAIEETDHHIAMRDRVGDGEPRLAPDDEHVAFAPTADGYRLTVLAGPAPAVGDELELDGRRVVCTRLGGSPLPLDTRLCAYLEPVDAAPRP